jgi:hypothetical protein
MVQPILGCPEEDTPHSPFSFEQDFLDWFLSCLLSETSNERSRRRLQVLPGYHSLTARREKSAS